MSPPFMERSPDSIAMPLHDMTTLICKMNIPTENFTWRHYPLVDPTRPNATLNLANAVYKEVPSKYIRSDNLTTEVQITVSIIQQTTSFPLSCISVITKVTILFQNTHIKIKF